MKKTILKRCFAVMAAGMMAFSMASCSVVKEKFDDWFGKGNSENAIILPDVAQAKNVILMIGDGMGPVQIKAGEIYKGKQLAMQGFPYMTKVETRSQSSAVTDSSAAATALATGRRTANKLVGKTISGEDLETIVDIAHNMGKRTGVITTEELHGGTPMGFSAHSLDRSDADELMASAATTSNVNLFASYKLSSTHLQVLANAGYEKIARVDALSEATAEKVFGSYFIRATAPSMSAGEDMTTIAFDRVVTEALEYLSKDEDGFFLMAEGAHIDHGGHNNDMMYMLQELLAFDDAVRAVLEWAEGRDDTVVIVTADHETGGLELDEAATTENILDMGSNDGGMLYAPLYYRWTTVGHTDTDVNCYINGANVDFSKYAFGTKERIENTDIFQIMKGLFTGSF